MNGFGHSPEDEHQPVMWWRGHPVYAAYFIIVVFTVSMVVTSLTMRFDSNLLINWLAYTSSAVLRGEVWRIFTYGLVNEPSIPFVIDMLMIAWFGREVERHLGRRIFSGLFAGIYLVTPLLFTLIGLWAPTVLKGETGALALFVAFAALFPNVMLMFNVLAKWAAVILVGIFSLMALAYHDTAGLISLWATTGLALAFVGFYQGRFSLPRFSLWRRGPKLRVLPDLPPAKVPPAKAAKEDPRAEMDALLDKIARSGMASLTAKERAKLAKAREDLLRK